MTAPADSAIARLEGVLNDTLAVQRRLLEVLDRQQAAVRCVDLGALAALQPQQQQLVRRLETLEAARRPLLEQLGGTGATMTTICAGLDEPLRARLGAVAGELRDVVESVRGRSAVVRAAAQRLDRHFAGIVQAAHAVLNRAGVYGARGRLAAGTTTEHALDLTS